MTDPIINRDLPRIVRESCVFRDDESDKVIERRIEETRARALEIAAAHGYKRPTLSVMYAPDSQTDLEAGRGWRVPARNWREALAECIWGRHARFTAIVREGEV